MSGQKAMDLTGQRFGRLTVLREGERRKKQRYWVCECECGNIKEVQQAHLRNGSIVSCGCKRKEYEDLTGQKFGRLTVIEEGKYDRMTGQITNRKWDLNIRYWVCQCDCGNIVEVPYTNLKNGNTRSCGCLLSETSSKKKYHRKYNLYGKKIGELKVGKYHPGTKYDPATYECTCSCGTVKNIPSYELLSGKTISCGCKGAENRLKGIKKFIKNDQVDGTRKSALKSKVHKDNKLGVKGVIWLKSRKKYQAYIGFKGKNIKLGYYNTLEEAKAARKKGEEKYHKPILEEHKDDK